MREIMQYMHNILYSIYNIIFQKIGIHNFIIRKSTITKATIELLKIIIYLTSNFSILQTLFKNIILFLPTLYTVINYLAPCSQN